MKIIKFFKLTRGMMLSAIILGIGLGSLLCGCTRRVYIPVESVVRDSVYSNTLRIDSVMMHDSIFLDSRGDTIIKEVYRTRYRTRVLTDTIYKSRIDSVPVVSEQTFSQQAKSAKSFRQQLSDTIIWGVRGLLVIVAIIFFIRLRNKN